MTTKTINATVPAQIKTEATAILASRGISMAAFLREMMACLAARDAETLAWIEKAIDEVPSYALERVTR